MIIAIDGPAGSGKSSVAKAVALRLGFRYLDTGAMYRALAVIAIRQSIDLHDDQQLAQLSVNCSVRFAFEPGEVLPSRVFFDDEDVTDYLRTPEIDAAVSALSASPGLREDMLVKQRRLGSNGDFVVEGRDIGSVVFPDAELKIFLTADVAERARRRVAQNKARGIESDYDEILASLIVRDERDTSREIAPLTRADDAVQLDSTNLTEEEVIDTIVDLAHARCAQTEG